MSDALEAVQIVALALVALGAWAVVAARDPTRQAVVASLYGLTLGVLFFAFSAPDVALSNIVDRRRSRCRRSSCWRSPRRRR